MTSSAAPFAVHIKKWHAVAAWTWNAGDDVCGICRMPFDACPPEGKYPGDDSPVVWGACGHSFHLQCINKWLAAQNQSEQRCPICRRVWDFKTAGTATAAGESAGTVENQGRGSQGVENGDEENQRGENEGGENQGGENQRVENQGAQNQGGVNQNQGVSAMEGEGAGYNNV